MTLFTTCFSTRFGLFSAAVDTTGAVVATAFGDLSALRRRLPGAGETAAPFVPDDRRTTPVRDQVLQYCAGDRAAFDIALAPDGSAFQHTVWQRLQTIPPGETRSYGELARALGTAARAVGRANATNPICLLIPCHRVIGGDGSLTGFAFGELLKRQLLDHERGYAGAIA